MDNRKAYLNWPSYDDDLVNKAYVDYKLKNLDTSSTDKDIKNLEKDVNNLKKDVTNINNNKLDKNIYDNFIKTNIIR